MEDFSEFVAMLGGAALGSSRSSISTDMSTLPLFVRVCGYRYDCGRGRGCGCGYGYGCSLATWAPCLYVCMLSVCVCRCVCVCARARALCHEHPSCVCVCVCARVCTHTRTHTHTHTHTPQYSVASSKLPDESALLNLDTILLSPRLASALLLKMCPTVRVDCLLKFSN
jgi:hypothetical protein